MQKACWVVILFVVVALGSCLDNDICLRGADNALVIDFIKFSEGEPVDDTITLLNVQATGADSIFYGGPDDDTDTVTTVTLAVNPYAESTFFTFNNFRGETQTLEVGYKTEVRFVSEECGSERLQYNLKVLGTSFDSVRVVSNSLNKGRSTNIEIYH